MRRPGREALHVERFVHRHHVFAPQAGGQGGAAVEGRVFPGGGKPRGVAGLGMWACLNKFRMRRSVRVPVAPFWLGQWRSLQTICSA